jgi:hypothetical protein
MSLAQKIRLPAVLFIPDAVCVWKFVNKNVQNSKKLE